MAVSSTGADVETVLTARFLQGTSLGTVGVSVNAVLQRVVAGLKRLSLPIRLHSSRSARASNALSVSVNARVGIVSDHYDINDDDDNNDAGADSKVTLHNDTKSETSVTMSLATVSKPSIYSRHKNKQVVSPHTPSTSASNANSNGNNADTTASNKMVLLTLNSRCNNALSTDSSRSHAADVELAKLIKVLTLSAVLIPKPTPWSDEPQPQFHPQSHTKNNTIYTKSNTINNVNNHVDYGLLNCDATAPYAKHQRNKMMIWLADNVPLTAMHPQTTTSKGASGQRGGAYVGPGGTYVNTVRKRTTCELELDTDVSCLLDSHAVPAPPYIALAGGDSVTSGDGEGISPWPSQGDPYARLKQQQQSFQSKPELL